ncbi:RidA family protein [Mesorhizobium sp. M0204]|uniref:RidA family protein n=1 Tax=Mesorhizobium sp. M0204 TaxID=2956913 RepID=UPI003338599F
MVVKYTGWLGEALSQETGYEAARLAALNVLSQLTLATEGDLSKVHELVKVSGFVACRSDFINIPAVVKGA